MSDLIAQRPNLGIPLMSDRLPKDLPGGWEFTGDYKPDPLQAGQIWRKTGPVEALKIVRVMQPGYTEYDGGAPGISICPTVSSAGGRIKWDKQTWFRAGTLTQIHDFLKTHGYSLAQPVEAY